MASKVRLITVVGLGALVGGCSARDGDGDAIQDAASPLVEGETLVCGGSHADVTTGGANRYDGYACVPRLSLPGSELTAPLTCPPSGEVAVRLKDFNRYPVVVILRDLAGAPNPDDCLGGNYYSATATCTPGEPLHVVLDHHSATEQLTTDLVVECAGPTVEDCANGWDDDGDGQVDCADSDCEGQSCDDGDACTDGDLCTAGSCVPGAKICGGPECSPLPQPVDCDTRALSGDTAGAGAVDAIDTYSCMPGLNQTDSEIAYEFTAPADEDIKVTVSHASYATVAVIEDNADSCFSDACLAGNWYQADFTAEAGKKYYFVVDRGHWTPAQTEFELSVICSPPTVEQGTDCADHADNDGDRDVDCADSDCEGQPCDDGDPCTDGDVCTAGACVPGTWTCNGAACTTAGAVDCTTRLLAGDTNGPEALTQFDQYSCMPDFDMAMSDVVYEFTAPANEDVLVTLDRPGYATVAVLEDRNGSCLGDACVAGNWYHATFTAQAGTTYYFAVDRGERPTFRGDFRLSVVCSPPVSEDLGDCGDGVDDDGDRKTDCQDPDCDGLSCEGGTGLCQGTTCVAAPPCSDGEWSETGLMPCEPWTDCVPGECVDTEGTDTSDRTCFTCVADEYSDTMNAFACTLCPPGTFSEAGATSCTPCEANCLACKDETTCDTCASGYTSVGGDCLLTGSITSTTIPGSTGCSLLRDSNADQIDALNGGGIATLLRCGELRLAISDDNGQTFSAPVSVGVGLPLAGTVYARSLDDIFVLYGTNPDVFITRTTDRGATWSSPVLVGSPFRSSGPGPSVMLTERGPDLFATWGYPNQVGVVRRSANDGATWTALPNITLSGINYCPDLTFDETTGDLIYLNEGSRQTWRWQEGAPAFTLIGSLGPSTGYTDFAGGGPWVYGLGNSTTVSRGPLAAGTPFSVVTVTAPTSGLNGSMDVDSMGNLYLSRYVDSTTIQLQRWVAGAGSLESPTTVTLPSGSSLSALATPPNGHVSFTTVYSNTSQPISVYTLPY